MESDELQELGTLIRSSHPPTPSNKTLAS